MMTHFDPYVYALYKFILFFINYNSIEIDIFLLILLAWLIYSYALCGIFEKAGFKAWYAFIPIYNQFITYQIIFGKQKGWLFFINYILLLAPILHIYIFPFDYILSIHIRYSMAKAYGKNTLFAIGFILLPFIFIFFLPENSEYSGPQPFFGWKPFDADTKEKMTQNN